MREFIGMLFTNKRFLAAFFGITSMLLAPLVAVVSIKLGLSEGDSRALMANANEMIAYIVIAYVGGQSLSDTWGKGAPVKPEEKPLLGEILKPVEPPK